MWEGTSYDVGIRSFGHGGSITKLHADSSSLKQRKVGKTNEQVQDSNPNRTKAMRSDKLNKTEQQVQD